MDRAWEATVHWVTNRWTLLTDSYLHFSQKLMHCRLGVGVKGQRRDLERPVRRAAGIEHTAQYAPSSSGPGTPP